MSVDSHLSNQLGDLMASYQAGDVHAFEELYRCLLPMLRRYLLSLTLNLAHAEDLVQETFLQLHRARRTYTPPRPVKPWAFGIARHVYLMDRRAASRRQMLEVGDDALEELAVPPRAASVASRDLIQRALTELATDRREALLLHHVWGFSFREVAGLLGIRESAAKVRAHRGMSQLRTNLGVDGQNK